MNHPIQSGPNPVAPGVALLVVGILSLLCSCGLAIRSYTVLNDPDFDMVFKQQVDDMTEDQKRGLSQFGDPAEFGRNMMTAMLIVSCVGLVLSAAMALGGVGLMKGSKGLGLLGGAAALVPQLCCILGMPVGIWAIVVSLKLGKNPPQKPIDPSKVELKI